MTTQDATAYVNALRVKMQEHGKESVTDEELAHGVRCLRHSRAGAGKGSKAAPAPVTPLELSDF